MCLKLIPLDLTRGEGHHHPDIRVDGTSYLVKHRGRWMAGTFGTVWFGLNFHGWLAPLQYDQPGTNRSGWEEIHEIVTC